jgi:hypothetical protein
MGEAAVSSQAVATKTQQPMCPSAIPIGDVVEQMLLQASSLEDKESSRCSYWIDVPMDKYKEQPSPSFLNPSSSSLLSSQYTSR